LLYRIRQLEPYSIVTNRVVDPDSETLWIRIRIRIGNPDPDPGARKLRNFSGKIHFLVILKKFLPLKRFNYFLKKNFDEYRVTPVFFI
jgi:hypothetical protein